VTCILCTVRRRSNNGQINCIALRILTVQNITQLACINKMVASSKWLGLGERNHLFSWKRVAGPNDFFI